RGVGGPPSRLHRPWLCWAGPQHAGPPAPMQAVTAPIAEESAMPRVPTAFLFDLDGTLVDSVYQHVLAWKEALDREGVDLSVWRIHRKIGMSGGLFTNILLRETGLEITEDRLERLRAWHAEAYNRQAAAGALRPLPGARAGAPGTQRPTPARPRPARSVRCPARANCSPTSAPKASPGRSRPAAGWRPRRRTSPRSGSIRQRCR